MKQTIDYKYGKISFLDTDLYIGKALNEYGEREDEEMQLLLSLVKDGDVVFDVGANIGTVTIPIAQKLGSGRIYSFEPQPMMIGLLRENIALNHLTNVEVCEYALGEKRGRAGMENTNRDYNEENNYGGIRLLVGDEVDVKTLDEEFSHLDRCHLIKIDVEGMEAHVLRGARELIRKHQPILYVENDVEQNGSDLYYTIEGMGYVMYWHTPMLFNPNNWKGNKKNGFNNICAANMLCVPRGLHLKQTEHLRRPACPYDRFDSFYGTPKRSQRSNGWAGVARFGGIGDNLMAASVCYALKRRGYKVEMITGEKSAWSVFEHNPNIDKLSVKSTDEMFGIGSLEWQKWFRGRAEEYDIFAQLSHTCEGLLAFFPSMSQFHWPAHVRRQLANKNYLEMVHDIAGMPYDFGPLFYMSDLEREDALRTKRKIGERAICVVMSGSRLDKSHPRLPGVVARMIKELDTPVVLLGDPVRNLEDARQIETFVKTTNGSLAGLHVGITIESAKTKTDSGKFDWPIRRSISLAQVCDLVIGPDTGVMWAVAFEKMPKILMLGHASPENITKHWINTRTLVPSGKIVCWPCHRLHDAEPGKPPPYCTPNEDNSGAACISDISIETIVQTAREALNAK